jgi:hypothetical protein
MGSTLLSEMSSALQQWKGKVSVSFLLPVLFCKVLFGHESCLGRL